MLNCSRGGVFRVLAVRVLVSSRFLLCLRLQWALLCLCGLKSVLCGVLRVCFGSPCTNETAKRCSLHASWFLPPFRVAQSIIDASRTRTLGKPPPREILSASRKRAVPQEVHSNYIRHISLRSRRRRLRLAVERQLVAARWRGAYGISGNRGVSKLTSSARAWPRTRSRRSAGVPSASGLRRRDQCPLSAAAAFEALAAALTSRVNSARKERIVRQTIFGV